MLQKLTDTSLATKDFPFMAFRQVDLGILLRVVEPQQLGQAPGDVLGTARLGAPAGVIYMLATVVRISSEISSA